MIKIDCDYNIKDDIEFILESEKINSRELSERTKVSRATLDSIEKQGRARDDVCEKIYAYAYENKYRINAVKEELIKEKYRDVLFHGSKFGLSEVTVSGSRDNCDFGKGFYLGETYEQALSFVCENKQSSVYSFTCDLENLNVLEFNCSLEWMLAICYYRGTLGIFSDSTIVKEIIQKINDADVIIAPIADNRMFYIMTLFAGGEINANVALHSLSASKLGKQYIFKTQKALKQIVPIEKYYFCQEEKDDTIKKLSMRTLEIETKLKLSKREFREGLFIEELLK